MMERIVRGAMRFSSIVFAGAAALLVAGLYAYSQLDVEAYPNPVPPMIEIITQPTGWSAEEVERYVTIPLETGLSGMLELDHIRSQSLFGLSDIKCYFNWSPDYYVAQQRVLNRLGFIPLPAGITPQLSPWNAIGEVFRYQLIGKGYSTTELKSAEDWVLERQWKQVPGVIDVVSFGGNTKQYHVDVDPFRLKGQSVSLPQMLQAIANANQNVGGGYMEIGEQSYNVRGTGLISRLREIGDIVVTEKNGVPVRVRDLGEVLEGTAPRLGVVGKDAQGDIVQGTVLMRYGGDSTATLKGIHERLKFIEANHLLPPGMKIVPYYDRASLVKLTTHTVIENLLVGMLLVTLVLWAFLGHARAALITAVNIPLALMAAFVGMVTSGTPANLISLGAVDFGIVVESTVIMVENIFRHLARKEGGTQEERIGQAAAEVAVPMFSSTLVIAVAFVPLFTMTGVAGVIFSPMAHTYAFAIGGAILLALTLTPTIAAQALRLSPTQAEHHEHGTAFMRALDRFYRPVFGFALRRKGMAVAIATAVVAGCVALLPLLGSKFMPHLEEGNFWIRATLPVSISLSQSSKYVGQMRAILLGCPTAPDAPCDEKHRGNPEVQTVISQLGRPDDGTDPSGFYNIELFAPLAPREEWRRGMTKEKLTEALAAKFAAVFPGVLFNFSQYIADNVEEAMSGVKGENSVKVTGPDVREDEALAEKIVKVMASVKGVEDLGIFRSLGQPNLRITPDRQKAGRYGLNAGDVSAVVQAAIGGQVVTQVYEGERHYDLVVRWAPQFRQTVASIRDIPVATPEGGSVPLGQVATVVQEEGPSVIYREDLQRYVPVKFSVRGRDLAGTIAEAQEKIKRDIRLPYNAHLEWAGEINQLKETTQRLFFIIPLTLLIIMFLVYTSVRSWVDTLIVLANIPVACTGGILALLLTGTDFSISAAMGFISIFGIAIQDSLIVVTYAQTLWKQGHAISEGARMSAERGLRPVLMTICVAMLGLFPAAVSTGIGSESQKPLAIVVIGGALMLAFLPRLLQPALLVLCHTQRHRTPTLRHAAPAKLV